MSNLKQFATISYNGYEFKGPRNSVQLELQHVRDESGRYITHTVFRFSIDTWITSDSEGVYGDGSDASAHMKDIRAALSVDGGRFELSGFGFGDVTANTNDIDRDVNFGPKVTIMKMRNIGSGCIVLTWSIDVALKVCSGGNAIGALGRLKEYVYAMRWAIKPNGCTTRIVEGHIEIFNNRSAAGELTVNVTADDYRDLIFIPIPDGFLRSQPQEYTLSPNHQRLQFRVTDEEQLSENSFPPGVVNMSLEHAVSSNLFGDGGGFQNHTATFNGSIEMAKPFPASVGWAKAIMLMQERLVHAVNNLLKTPMITDLTVTEFVFERRLSFSLKYRLLGSSLKDLVEDSGLFTKVQSTTARAYRDSMAVAWANRGAARLMHDPTSDRMVDQCSLNKQIQIKDQVAEYFLDGATGMILLPCPPESNSYLMLENYIDFEDSTFTVDLQEMSADGTVTTTKRKPQLAGDGKPTIRFVVYGRSLRVGYLPQYPRQVESAWGSTVQLLVEEKKESYTELPKYGECRMYAGKWRHVYQVQFDSQSEYEEAKKRGINGASFKFVDPLNPNQNK